MIYVFEDFELNTDRKELRLSGVQQPMQPQVYALLELLVINHDRIVTKDEINEKIWGGRVISEAVVNSRIRSARIAVNDDGKSQRLIKTAHSRGFGFAITPQTIDNGVSQSPEPHDLEPGQQPRSANEIATSKPVVPREKTAIAVLPFKNMSDDPDQDHFADGISEDIITALTKVTDLAVYTYVMPQGADRRTTDLNHISRQFNVQYVLDGSVRRVDDQFRVSAQLIDVATENHVWAERYDREMENIFALQDEMTRQIISALQVELTDGELARIWANGTSDFSAWEAMIKSRRHCMNQTQSEILIGRKLAEKAIAIDENYGSAWRSLSYSYWCEMLGGWSKDPGTTLRLGREAAERANAFDDDDAGTLGLLALMTVAGRQYDEANEYADRIIKLGTTNHYANVSAAMVKLYIGDLRAAEVLINHSFKLIPTVKGSYLVVLATIYMFSKRHEEAIEVGLKSLSTDANYIYSHNVLAITYSEMGRLNEAQSTGQRILKIDPEYTVEKFAISQPYRDKELMDRCLEGLRKAGIPES